MATYAQFKHVELYKIGHGKNRVPNAPKSSIAEIFNADATDNGRVSNGVSRPRPVRDTPTRPRDTHSRLFGQVNNAPVQPMVTDTIRSHIQFGEVNNSCTSSPSKFNGSTCSSRGEMENAEQSSCQQPKRNPVTGDGMPYVPPRRRHPAASLRGADFDPDLLEPQPTHRYITRERSPSPANYYVHSTTKLAANFPQTPYSLIGLNAEENNRPFSGNNSSDPQYQLDSNFLPFPAQNYYEPELKISNYPLPPYSSIALTSKFGEKPELEYKRNPVPALDGPIDPYLMANCDPPPTLFKYERDGPIPDFTPIQTSKSPGPFTLTGFPPIFPKHVPGYLFKNNRHAEDLEPKTYFLDYIRKREMEGNPITGDYKSLNGQINTVTTVSGHTCVRIPPGGYSNALW